MFSQNNSCRICGDYCLTFVDVYLYNQGCIWGMGKQHSDCEDRTYQSNNLQHENSEVQNMEREFRRAACTGLCFANWQKGKRDSLLAPSQFWLCFGNRSKLTDGPKVPCLRRVCWHSIHEDAMLKTGRSLKQGNLEDQKAKSKPMATTNVQQRHAYSSTFLL